MESLLIRRDGLNLSLAVVAGLATKTISGAGAIELGMGDIQAVVPAQGLLLVSRTNA